MNRRQKALLAESLFVLGVTLLAVVGMINFKDYINRSEAMRAMEQLRQRLYAYRSEQGILPAQSYVDQIRRELAGHVRMGEVMYRALWIDFDATPDEIVAYTEKTYRSSFLEDGYIVIRLGELHQDGRVEWMRTGPFRKLLAEQQSPAERTIILP